MRAANQSPTNRLLTGCFSWDFRSGPGPNAQESAQIARTCARESRLSHWNNGAQGRIRTTDTRIFSPLLYQLSYLGP